MKHPAQPEPTMTTAATITDSQIEAIQIEAGMAGDSATVADCKKALDGVKAARRRIARIIADNA